MRLSWAGISTLYRRGPLPLALRAGPELLHPGGHFTAPRAPLLLQGARLILALLLAASAADHASPTTTDADAVEAATASSSDLRLAGPGSALASLLHRTELPAPGPETRPSARRGCRFSALTQVQVVERLHIIKPPVLRDLYRMALGVPQFTSPPGAQLVPDHLPRASLRRRAAPAAHTPGSRALSVLLPVGERWHVDMLPHMPACLSGFVTGAFFMEDQRSFLKLWPMRPGLMQRRVGACTGLGRRMPRPWVLSMDKERGSDQY